MKKFTKGRKLVHPGISRFATNFIILQRIVHHKKALYDMFHLEGWMKFKYGRNKKGAYEVKKIALGYEFGVRHVI